MPGVLMSQSDFGVLRIRNTITTSASFRPHSTYLHGARLCDIRPRFARNVRKGPGYSSEFSSSSLAVPEMSPNVESPLESVPIVCGPWGSSPASRRSIIFASSASSTNT